MRHRFFNKCSKIQTNLQLRMGTPGHRIYARHVRSSGPTFGHFQRRKLDLRVLLPPYGAHGGELPQRQRDGLPFR